MDNFSTKRPTDVGNLYDETILANAEITEGRRVLLHAERPHIEKRLVRGQLALVTRHSVTVRKTIEVDVTHEELRVEYVPGDGTETLDTDPETFCVLLRAEEIEIVKRVRVVEEVFISKRTVVERNSAKVALKRETLELLN